MIIPPLCVTPTMKAIDTLFFDYIIVLYPILISVAVYFWIELHDHGCRVITFLSLPLCRLNCSFWGNPKVSQSYSNCGDRIPNSTVLLYDPTIISFNHIPYIIVALSVIVTFILLPSLSLHQPCNVSIII